VPDVFNTLQIFLGSLYVNDFNLFGAPFASHCRPTRIRERRRRTLTGSTSVTPAAAWSAEHARPAQAIVGPETVPHYNNYASALVNGGAAPGYSSGQAVTAMERPLRSRFRAISHSNGPALTYQELKAGSIANGSVRAGDRLRVPDPGRAI